jgi:hypothetical protein
MILMATYASDFADRDVSIGRIFNRAFGTIGSNPVATLGIAFLFGALPGTLIGYGSQYLRRTDFAFIGFWGTVAIGLATMVLSIVFSMITQGALVRATIAHSEGRQSSFQESVMAGLVVAWPLFLLALVSALGIGFAMVLLIVPGIMIYIRWSVAAPALVEERIGVLDALSRSSGLTDGVRWKIFGLLLIAVVGNWMFSAALGAFLFAMFGGMQGMRDATATGSFPFLYYVVTAVANTLTSAVWGVLLTSLYVELRNWKDGPATDTLAEVFA